MRASAPATIERGAPVRAKAARAAPQRPSRAGARRIARRASGRGLRSPVARARPYELNAIAPRWIAAGVALEIASCVSFVIVFRAFFDQLPPSLARRIAWIEMGSGALLPRRRRDQLRARRAAPRPGRNGPQTHRRALRRSLLADLGRERPRPGLGCSSPAPRPHRPRPGLAGALLPLLLATPLTLLIAASPRLVAHRPQHTTASRWLSALVDGVADAWRAARHQLGAWPAPLATSGSTWPCCSACFEASATTPTAEP